MIQKAGGIITRTHNGETHVYLIHRSRYNDWSFPKGHIEEGESPEQGAVREVQEETGIACTVVRHLPPYIYDMPNGETSEVWMFELKETGESTPKDNEADEGKWVSIEEAQELVSYPSLQEYIKKGFSRG